MKKRIKLADAVGKVLTGATLADYDVEGLLIFGDEFVFLRQARGYDGDPGSLEEEGDFNLSRKNISDDQLVECGFISREELNTFNSKADADRKQAEEERGLRLFEHLKKRFGP